MQINRPGRPAYIAKLDKVMWSVAQSLFFWLCQSWVKLMHEEEGLCQLEIPDKGRVSCISADDTFSWIYLAFHIILWFYSWHLFLHWYIMKWMLAQLHSGHLPSLELWNSFCLNKVAGTATIMNPWENFHDEAVSTECPLLLLLLVTQVINNIWKCNRM